MSSFFAILFCVLLVCWCVVEASLSDPTSEEIIRGVEVLADQYWGHQARVQNSLRILCIGGSNTANCKGTGGYVDLLRDGVMTLKSDGVFRNQSYVLNNGESGFGPVLFLGKKYAFEEWNTDRWPNVIIVDASVNMGAYPPILPLLEKLVQFFAWKYHDRGLSSPDIMFYNMPHLKEMFREPFMNTTEERLAYVKKYPSIPFVFAGDEFIYQIGSHYHFPVLSYGNATHAAGLRHFIEYGNFESPKWLYSNDGVHMSCPPFNGTKFGNDNLLMPFFRAVMVPRKDDKLVDFNIAHPRLLPPSPILIESLTYYAGERVHSMFELTTAIAEKSQWKEMPLQHFAYCVGSSDAGAVGEAHIIVPAECTDRRGCRMQLSFIHSWNMSYIGNASCTLHYHPHRDHAGVHLASLHIDGQADSQKATIPVKSEFGVNVTAGQHSIKCVNLIQDRLSCLLGIHVNTVVVT